MKRTFAKRSFMRFLMGFFLFGVLAFSANRASAQSWVSPAEALIRLDNAIQTQKGLVGSNNPGTTAYENAVLHAVFYSNIIVGINDGMLVGPAVDSALTKAVDSSTTLANPMGKAQLQALYNDAASLLQ